MKKILGVFMLFLFLSTGVIFAEEGYFKFNPFEVRVNEPGSAEIQKVKFINDGAELEITFIPALCDFYGVSVWGWTEEGLKVLEATWFATEPEWLSSILSKSPIEITLDTEKWLDPPEPDKIYFYKIILFTYNWGVAKPGEPESEAKLFFARMSTSQEYILLPHF